MKTLENQTLLFDNDCPMCKLYTKSFVNVKMLDENGAQPFNKKSIENENYIDIERASNEIALIDTKNKTIVYGIDSLLKIIGHSIPLIKKIGNFKPVYFLLKKLYFFISFNRKVIIPNAKNNTNGCIPNFNIKYRLLYIGFSNILTIFVLYKYTQLISVLPKSYFKIEIILAIGQIIFQLIFMYKEDFKNKLNYIGNLVTISLIGCFVLLPIIIFSQIFILPQQVILIWFTCTVIFMIYEHYRRIKTLELPKYLTFTCILYRIIALIIISKLYLS